MVFYSSSSFFFRHTLEEAPNPFQNPCSHFFTLRRGGELNPGLSVSAEAQGIDGMGYSTNALCLGNSRVLQPLSYRARPGNPWPRSFNPRRRRHHFFTMRS